MPREIDPRVTAKALRKLKRAAKEAEEAGLVDDWEEEFFSSVEERLEEYGSAFHDPEKGARDAALSVRQTQVLARLRAEARKKKRSADREDGKEGAEAEPRACSSIGSGKAKSRSGWGHKGKAARGWAPRVRQIEEDVCENQVQAVAEEPVCHPPGQSDLPDNVIPFRPAKRA